MLFYGIPNRLEPIIQFEMAISFFAVNGRRSEGLQIISVIRFGFT